MEFLGGGGGTRDAGRAAGGSKRQRGVASLPVRLEIAERGDCIDGLLKGGDVLVVVVACHRRGLVADDGLDDVQWNARIRRKRNESVPQGVEGRLRRTVAPSLDADRGLDVRLFEDNRKPVADPPASRSVKLGDLRQDGTGECSA